MNSEQMTHFLPHPRPYYPWLVLLISLLFQLYKSLLLVIPSIIAPELTQAFHSDTLNLRLLVLSAVIPLFLFQIPIGIFLDKFGTRKITSLGILMSALGVILFANSSTLMTAYTGRFLIGIGASTAIVNIVKILVHWFHPKLFATLFGLTIALAALGDLLGIYITSTIIDTFGWRLAMMNYGLAGIIFSALFFALVKDNAPGAQYDIHPNDRPFKLKAAIIRMLKHKQSWMLALFAGFVQTPFPVSIGLLGIPYLKSKHFFTEDQARFIFGALLLGLCISAPLMGYLSTYIKKRKLFITSGSCIVTLLSILPMLPISLNYLNYAFIFFFQAIFIGMLPLGITMMKEQNIPQISATSFTFVHTSYIIFACISELLTKLLFHSHWNHRPSFTTIIPTSHFPFIIRVTLWFALAFIVSLFIKETYAKQRLQKDPIPKDFTRK